MKKLSNSRKKQIQKLEKLYKQSHIILCNLQEFLLNKGLDEDILKDELNSLKLGDYTSEDFIKWIEEEFEYLNS